ncbi:MAG: DNA primase [Anaerolineae bacterium]|nr:DNA primase [Anaerolineae bacterium]
MSVVEEIKARLDIVQFISQYVPLKKAGRNFTAPCPFHIERTPSFVVFPETQGWHCFGACGEGGDIFNFVMKRENLDFPAAVQFLADKAGIEVKPRTDEQRRIDEHRDKLRGLVEEAVKYYHQLLVSAPEAAHAREYVRRRGLSDETILKFQLGYAPRDWDAALTHLNQIGYQSDDLIEIGCAIRNDAGRIYDRFRDRLMIPICDERGKHIGFGARALRAGDEPKYLNSPQTPLFDKSATLFALHLARPAIREQEVAVIVEGYMDAITAHQAGFTNVIAQMGTALTKPQLRQLSAFAKRLILALDADAAGVRATMRGLNVMRESSESHAIYFDPATVIRQASRFDLEIQVATVPEGKDPDDLIRKDPEAWRTLIQMAQPVSDYVISVGTAHLTPESSLSEREAVARDLLPILVATENDLARQANVQQLAYKLRLGSGRALLEWAQHHLPNQRLSEIPRWVQPTATSEQAASGVVGTTSVQPAPLPAHKPMISINAAEVRERFCVVMLVQHPELLSFANRRFRELAAESPTGKPALTALNGADFTHTQYRAVFLTLAQGLEQLELEPYEFVREHLPHLVDLIDDLREEPLENFKTRLREPLRIELKGVLRERGMSQILLGNDENRRFTFERCALELRRLRLRRENAELETLQQESDQDALMTYQQRVNANSAAIARIEIAMRRGA